MSYFRNFIAGEWKPSAEERWFKDVNPSDTRDVLGFFPDSSGKDVGEAVDAAREAFDGWAATPPSERGRILLKAALILEEQVEELVRLLSREEGKTLAESRIEVLRTVEIFKFFAGAGHRLKGETIPSMRKGVFIYTCREPLGVVGVITPWNFPIAIPAWKIAPALVCGNTVVFKPSSLTPLIAQKIVEALERAGLPKGVLNLIHGGAEVGRSLVTSKLDAISFTGSHEVGSEIYRRLAEAGRMIRYQMEMGGKNPFVVMADADLERAVTLAAKSAFGLTGQACTAASRILVEEEVYDTFLEKFVEKASKIKVGNPLKGEVDMGPAVSEQQLEKDLKYIEIGKQEGAKLVCGGERLRGGDYDYGYFIAPTVFTEVTKDMKIAQEEIFGPVACVMKFKGLDEAIELANSVEYGLCAGICTSSLAKALEFANRVEAGVVKVNDMTVGIELQVPFGGFKKSSSMTFKEQGDAALEFYTRLKSVYIIP